MSTLAEQLQDVEAVLASILRELTLSKDNIRRLRSNRRRRVGQELRRQSKTQELLPALCQLGQRMLPPTCTADVSQVVALQADLLARDESSNRTPASRLQQH